MEPLDRQDIGLLAADFLGDLDKHAVQGFSSAILIAANIDEDGDIRITMRTSDENAFANIQVLQTAQLVETRHLMGRGADAA